MTKAIGADSEFSRCIRERANWTCERCGIEDAEAQAKGTSTLLDCSHVYSRAHRSTRWHPDNCFCLCKSCHAYLEGRPIEHTKFAEEKLGPTRFEWLVQAHHQPVKFTKADHKAMKKHYREEYARMRELRNQGEQGHIEFVGFV